MFVGSRTSDQQGHATADSPGNGAMSPPSKLVTLPMKKAVIFVGDDTTAHRYAAAPHWQLLCA